MRDPGGISQESSNEKSAFARFKGNRIAVSIVKTEKEKKEGEKEMKKFNFKKLGILLVMMLAGALVLVGPASAYSQVYTDDYRFRCGGSSGSPTSYWAAVNTLDYSEAEHLLVTPVLYNQYGNYVAHVSDDAWDESSLTVQGYYASPVPGGYVDASFDNVDPTEAYWGLVCYLY